MNTHHTHIIFRKALKSFEAELRQYANTEGANAVRLLQSHGLQIAKKRYPAQRDTLDEALDFAIYVCTHDTRPRWQKAASWLANEAVGWLVVGLLVFGALIAFGGGILKYLLGGA